MATMQTIADHKQRVIELTDLYKTAIDKRRKIQLLEALGWTAYQYAKLIGVDPNAFKIWSTAQIQGGKNVFNSK